jgi:HSP20 family protein
MNHWIVPRARRRSPLAARRLASPGLFADFDRFFDAFWGDGAPLVAREETPVFAPPLDYQETEQEIRVSAELPGIEEKDIKVSLEDDVLTIEAERGSDRDEEDERGFRHLESVRGQLRRSVRLGAEVDEESVAARYRNGVLTVTLPKLAGPEVRNIPVTTS